MNRFRIYDKDTKKFFYIDEETMFIKVDNEVRIFTVDKETNAPNLTIVCNNGIVMRNTEVIDINGNFIYEGDIIKVPDDYDEFGMMACEEREIWYKDGGFRLRPKDEFQLKKGARGHWLEDNKIYTVIGTVYDSKGED